MTETIVVPSGLLDAGPVSPAQAEAWARFEQLPMPARTDESWRFANVRTLELGSYTQPLALDDALREELVARSTGLSETAGRIVFGNDQLLAQEQFASSLQDNGVLWLSLEQARQEHPELLEKYFMREDAILGAQKFAALHESQVKAGTVLFVPRGVEVALPLETYHWLHGVKGSVFPHTLIIAEERAKVTLVDYFQSANPDLPGLACAVNDVWLGAGANVSYVCVQDWGREVLSFQIQTTVVGRDAHARTLFAQLGSKHARCESVSRLRGSGGRSDMLAVTVAQGEQELDARTLQVHEAPHTSSDLLYKNSLDDTARTVFAGLIRVDEVAQKTDAYQKVRNLLLSDEAEANSAPGLEIEANDVRCTHGATSGQIEAEELFYLMSRGISKRQAQRLIVHGFLQEAIDRIGDTALAAHLEKLVQAKLERRS